MPKIISVTTLSGGKIHFNPDFLVAIVERPDHYLLCLSHVIGNGADMGNVVPVKNAEYERVKKILDGED